MEEDIDTGPNYSQLVRTSIADLKAISGKDFLQDNHGKADRQMSTEKAMENCDVFLAMEDDVHDAHWKAIALDEIWGRHIASPGEMSDKDLRAALEGLIPGLCTSVRATHEAYDRERI